MPKLPKVIIEAAILGFESRKLNIDNQIVELRRMLDGGPVMPAATSVGAAGTRKRFSAATRRKMAAAQKLRWAKLRGKTVKSA
jgi:hypothetical protein